MRSVKEVLNRFDSWLACYFTNKKCSWYRPTGSCIDYCKLSLVLPKKAASVYIAPSNDKLRPIAIFEQFVNEQYAKKQQWPK